MSDDRTVHAKLPDGTEIVRYDRAGKWFTEAPPGSMISCSQISVSEAARLVVEGEGFAHIGRPGGKIFDAKVLKLRGIVL